MQKIEFYRNNLNKTSFNRICMHFPGNLTCEKEWNGLTYPPNWRFWRGLSLDVIVKDDSTTTSSLKGTPTVAVTTFIIIFYNTITEKLLTWNVGIILFCGRSCKTSSKHTQKNENQNFLHSLSFSTRRFQIDWLLELGFLHSSPAEISGAQFFVSLQSTHKKYSNDDFWVLKNSTRLWKLLMFECRYVGRFFFECLC